MMKRQVAIVLEFEDDDALAAWQRHEWADPWVTLGAVEAAVAELQLPGHPMIIREYFTAKPHPYSPYVYDRTLHNMRLHGPERPSEKVIRLMHEQRRTEGRERT